MPRLECVIFDLDNTLVDSDLDFDQIKREIGTDMTILEYRAKADPAEQQRVDRILAEHEARAAETCTYCTGAWELLEFLKQHDVRTALLTRNSRRTIERVSERLGMGFDATLSREESEPKPSPKPIRQLCETLDVAPARTLMVGDFLYDMQAAERAGAMTLLVHSQHRHKFDYDADFEVETLHDAIPVVEELLSDARS